VTAFDPKQSWRQLFNHLVSAQQQRWRDGKPQFIGDLLVDHHFELRRLLNGQIRGLFAAQNAANVDGRFANDIVKVSANS
jgi:hypothetical protein